MIATRLLRTTALLLIGLTAIGCYVVAEPPVTTPPPRPAPPAPPPPPPPPRPVATVDLDFFYGALDPYGDWIWIEPYGWVWAPVRVEPFWRPYTVGYWSWTDWGWMWVSSEPWGWATYHYGRWARVSRYGWVWVPGTTWGPAWVAWRHGGGVVGWAPLPPGVRFVAGVGLDWGGLDIDIVIRTDWWCFVDDVRFIDRDVYRYAYPVGRNPTAVKVTRNATRYRTAQGRIVNEGIERGEIERKTRRAIPAHRVVDRGEGMRRTAEVERGEVRVYRPDVREAKPGVSPPRGRRAEDVGVPQPGKPRPPVQRVPPRPTDPEAERKFDQKWLENWRKQERVQAEDDKEIERTTRRRDEVLKQHREENYEAAENAARELQAEKDRAARRAERPAPAPPASRKAVKKGRADDKKKDDEKKD